jgi:hypothetical protein
VSHNSAIAALPSVKGSTSKVGWLQPLQKQNSGIAGCRSRGAFPSLGVLLVEGNAQVKRAEAEVLDILQSARGRGKDGLSSEQLLALAAAIYVLEEDGGLKVVSINSRARLVLLLR